MVGITEIPGILTSLKSAKDIVEAMAGLRDAAIFQEKRLELQSKIMDAQSSVFLVNEERAALIKRVSDLEKEVAGYETWKTEKQRYELKEVSQLGGFAYVLKKGMEEGEPPHCLCANCYQNNKKRFLQGTPNTMSERRIFHCNECQSNVGVEMGIFNAR